MTDATLVLGVDSRQVAAGAKSLDDLAAAGGRAEQAANKTLAGWTKAGAAAGLALAAIGGAFVTMTKNAIDAADAMNDMHLKTGLAFKNLAAYDLLARQSGTSLQGVAQGFKFLGSYMVEHSDKLKLIGVTSKDTNIAMGQFADAIAGIQDPALKTKIAMEVLGRSGMELIPMLSGGSAAFAAAQKQTEAYASALEKAAPMADQFNDGLARMEIGAKVIGLTLANEMLPTLIAVSDALLQSSINGGMIEKWGATGAAILKVFAIAAFNVAYVVQQIGDSIGGVAAKFAAILSGDFAQVGVIERERRKSAKAAREEIDKLTESIWNARPATASATTETAKMNKELDIAARKMLSAKQAADELAARLADIEKDRLYTAFEEDKKGRIAHSQFLLTVELGRIKDAAQAEQSANQESADIAISEYLRRGEAAATLNSEYVKQVEEETKQRMDMWKSIDTVARDTFVNIWGHGKSTLDRLRDTLKNGLLAMLYEMGKKQFLINVGMIAGGAGMSGAAQAATGGADALSGASGLFSAGTMLGSLTSGISGAMSMGVVNGFTAGLTSIASQGFSSYAAGLMLPGVGVAIGLGALLLGRSHGTPTSSTGDSAMAFSPTGTMLERVAQQGHPSTVASDKLVQDMNKSYLAAAKQLGVSAANTIFSFAGNTGRNAQNPQFALGGGVIGGTGFYQGETAMTDSAVQLAASRAVFTALQGSELPVYLKRVFEGLDAAKMSSQDISNTLSFAGALKQVRDGLTETRTPMEILAAAVAEGMSSLGTSADTFRTDFVAAIDAGLTPERFQEWAATGAMLDQQLAAQREAANRTRDLELQLLTLQGKSTQALNIQRELEISAMSAADAAIQRQIYTLQDEAAAATKASEATQQLANDIGGFYSAMGAYRGDSAMGHQATFDAAFTGLQKLAPWIKDMGQLATMTAEDFGNYDAAARAAINATLDAANVLKNDVPSAAVAVAQSSQKVAEAYGAADKAQSSYLQGLVQFGKSVKDFLLGLETGADAASPQAALAAAQKQYAANVAGARAGDAESYAALTKGAQTYIDSARAVYGSGDRMSAVLGQIKADLGDLPAVKQYDANLAALNAIQNAVQSSGANIVGAVNVIPPAIYASTAMTISDKAAKAADLPMIVQQIMADSRKTIMPVDYLSGMKKFASGGDFSGGLRLVGENGPEIEMTGPSRIFNAAQTRSALSGGKEVVEELRNVKATLARLLEQGNDAVRQQTHKVVGAVTNGANKSATATKEAAALAVTN